MIADSAEMREYVSRWFLSRERLVAMTGCAPDDVDALLDAEAGPGPVYASHSGGWWSALAHSTGQDGPMTTGATPYYSPGTPWWLRRATLQTRAGASAQEAALGNSQAFAQQFIEALAAEPMAKLSFAGCFVGVDVDEAAARAQASAEWRDWTDGGYAVCLHHFTGSTCVQKETLASVLKKNLAGATSPPSRSESLELLDLAHRLSVLILPFSPQERPVGTPGVTIDRLLATYHLGAEFPFTADTELAKRRTL